MSGSALFIYLLIGAGVLLPYVRVFEHGRELGRREAEARAKREDDDP